MQMCRESNKHLLDFPSPAEALGDAHLSEGLCWESQALSEVLQCPRVPALCLKADSKNYFCQGLSPAISCGGR